MPKLSEKDKVDIDSLRLELEAEIIHAENDIDRIKQASEKFIKGLIVVATQCVIRNHIQKFLTKPQEGD